MELPRIFIVLLVLFWSDANIFGRDARNGSPLSLLRVAHCVIHGEALPPPLLGVLELLE